MNVKIKDSGYNKVIYRCLTSHELSPPPLPRQHERCKFSITCVERGILSLQVTHSRHLLGASCVFDFLSDALDLTSSCFKE